MTDIAPKNRKTAFLQALTLFTCVAFGVAMIANTQLACDGAWFWYATLVHGGQHLYSDMHVVFQPLFVLETGAWMSLTGNGWLISRGPALFHLIVFSVFVLLLAWENAWTDLQKAVLTACAFFVCISFEAYRFDDFHVLSDICTLLALFLLINLNRNETAHRKLAISLSLGAVTGLAITNRITDGGALFLGAALGIFCIAINRRFLLITAYSMVAIITVASVVRLTGDSFQAYIMNTILHAAGPKGGAANVLTRPFLLPWNSLAYLAMWKPLVIIFLSALVAVSWTFLLKPFSRSNILNSTIKAAIGITVLCVTLYELRLSIKNGEIIVALSAVLVLAAYGLAVFVAFRLVRNLLSRDRKVFFNPKQIIVFVPFSLLLAGSLSSAGYHFGLYAPVAILLLVVPVVLPEFFARDWIKSCFLAVALLMTASGAWFKAEEPSAWAHYRTFPMFSNRLVVRHPVYGSMVIDKDLHHFIERTCSVVNTEPNSELLSIPEPYANYYCAKPPWQGFVQTFFDTSGKDVIDTLVSKLEQSPPKWILYQRQLDVLSTHERLFNNGRRLPHRDLDEFIVKKLRSRQWALVDRQPYLGNDWLLVRTH